MPDDTIPGSPPFAVPLSPTSPTTTAVSSGDWAGNDGSDPEKGIIRESSEENQIAEHDVKGDGFRSKVTGYLRRLSSSSTRPRIVSSEDERTKLIQRIDDHPRGYSQLAAFMNCDENFLICRKYGFLRSRVLLYRQDELSKLEKQLTDMDDEDADACPDRICPRLMSRKTDESGDDERKTLIQTIDDKLKEYDELVSRIRIYVSLKAPCQRDLKSFVNWIWDHKPLSREESAFLKHTDDFVAISNGQEWGWLDGVVEDTFTACLPQNIMKKFFTSKEQGLVTNDRNLHLISKYRTDMLVRLVLTLTTVGLLIGPSAVLFTVPGHATLKIVLIMVFTLLFSIAIGVATKAKRHEMLAATATYAAVLVVFLGNFGPGS